MSVTFGTTTGTKIGRFRATPVVGAARRCTNCGAPGQRMESCGFCRPRHSVAGTAGVATAEEFDAALAKYRRLQMKSRIEASLITQEAFA